MSTDPKLPFGTYRKPSGALAAYPLLRIEVDAALQEGQRRETLAVRYVSQAEYDRLLKRAQEQAAPPLDPEVRPLVEALNAIPTVRATSSCCGHGAAPVRVFFDVGDMAWLYVIGRAIDRNYGGYGFRCELVTHDLPERPVGFMLVSETGGNGDLRGPSLQGQDAYQAADALATRIRAIMSSDHILQHFGLQP